MNKKLTYILMPIMVMGLTSCSDNTQDNTHGQTTDITVPMGISLGVAWDTDDTTSRNAPPEQGDGLMDGTGTEEIKEIDRVRIIAFRRKDPDITNQDAAEFVYDPTNDQTVTCQEGTPNYTAQGALTKIYGYEYRVIAIAYDTDDESWFSLNNLDGVTYEEFMMTINKQDNDSAGGFNNKGISIEPDIENYNVYFTPQFFYGYCHLAGSDDPIIKYGETADEASAPLTGVLYRAVAKVEVSLTVKKYNDGIISHDIEQAALLMSNVYSQTKLSSYDDFLSPTLPCNENNSCTVVCYNSEVPSAESEMTMTVYVLPTQTKLGLAIYYQSGTIITSTHTHAGWFSPQDLSFADGATGIISPDVYNKEFYFRRNHKYVITGTTNNAFPE